MNKTRLDILNGSIESFPKRDRFVTDGMGSKYIREDVTLDAMKIAMKQAFEAGLDCGYYVDFDEWFEKLERRE